MRKHPRGSFLISDKQGPRSGAGGAAPLRGACGPLLCDLWDTSATSAVPLPPERIQRRFFSVSFVLSVFVIPVNGYANGKVKCNACAVRCIIPGGDLFHRRLAHGSDAASR
jgi:hypothetical protein